MSWVYLTLGVIAALIVLGAVAIDQAYRMHSEAPVFPATPVPTLTIDLEENALLWHNGFPFLNVERGENVSIPLTVSSHIDRNLQVELSITYGPGNEEPVLPPGVSAQFNPRSLELLPRQGAKSNITFHIDKGAPDGTYLLSMTAYDSKNKEGIGTSFSFVVGEGSSFFLGPNGKIGPAPTFVQQCPTDDLPTGGRTGPYIELLMTNYELTMKASESANVTIYLISANNEEAKNLVNHLSGCKLRILQPGEIHYPYDENTVAERMPLGTGAGLEKYILTIKPSNKTLDGLSNQLILDSTKLTVYSTNSARPGTYLIGIPVEGQQGVLYRALPVIRLTIT